MKMNLRVIQKSNWLGAEIFILAILSLLNTNLISAEEAKNHFRSTSGDRRQTSITVYNSDLGLVKEVRELKLGKGLLSLDFMDVASKIQTETVHIKSLSDPASLSILEQNYQYDLLSPEKLLEKYVGKKVKVYRWNDVTGKDEEREAEVLSTQGGAILKIGNEITYGYPGRFSFPDVPKNLISKPTLVWLLNNTLSSQKLEVSYLTEGMTWKADYVLTVNQEETGGDFNGWVTLNNTSGTAYENATLKLVAGDVHRIPKPQAYDYYEMKAEAAPRMAQKADFKEESFFEYHLYTLQRPTSLLDNEQKQVSLLEAPGIKIEKHLIFYGQPYYYRNSNGQVMSNQKVGVYLDIQNKKENGMGMPLPKGNVRVYKADTEGSLQFIGEDAIDHTPKDEKVSIKMGEAFDVVADRKQMEWKALSDCMSESSWEISVRNHKNEDAVVEIVEPVGGDWEILSSSQAYERKDSNTFIFKVNVPKNGEVKVQYRVRIKWC